MSDDEDNLARLIDPEGLLDGPPAEGDTHVFSLKLESWMEDMAAELAPKGAPRPAAGLTAEPGAPPAAQPTPVPFGPQAPPAGQDPLGSAPFGAPPREPSPSLAALPLAAPAAGPDLMSAPAPYRAPSPSYANFDAAGPRASAVPPIPSLAASAVPPIPSLAASAVPPIPAPAPREDPVRRALPLMAVLAILLAAGGAGWLLFGAEIRARLPL